MSAIASAKAKKTSWFGKLNARKASRGDPEGRRLCDTMHVHGRERSA
jgi:hypothetical protein